MTTPGQAPDDMTLDAHVTMPTSQLATEVSALFQPVTSA